MYLSIPTFIILAVLAVPVSTAFLKTVNICLARHSALMLEEDGVDNPQIYISKPILWCTVFIILLLAYVKSISIGQILINSLFLLGLLLITYIDIKYQYIFDEVVIALGALAILATPYIQYGWLERLGAVVAGGLLMLLVAVMSKGMLGGGDIKLVAMLGLWQGLSGLYVCLTVGFVSAAIFALLALVSGRKKMNDTIAFGPYLALGAFVYWLGIYSI